MDKITLEEFISQWVVGKWDTVKASHLAKAVFDFRTKAGDYSLKQFQSSFSSGGFCGGTPWQSRTSHWGKKYTHPVMNDTTTLANTITSKEETYEIGSEKSMRISKNFTRSAHYMIRTMEKSRSIKGKRGTNSKSDGSYAAVHNTDPQYGLYTVNQYSKRRPVHRQFIGFNPTVEDYINTHYVDMIFEDFPK